MNENYVLVTGGAGFIGSYLYKQLKGKYNIICIDNFDEQVHGDNNLTSPNVIQFDICKDDFQLLDRFGTPSAIFHLAAKTGTSQSMYQLEDYYQTNVVGSIRLIDYAMKNLKSLKHFIFASSRSVYGEGTYHCLNCEAKFLGRRTSENLRSGVFHVECPACDHVSSAVATSEDSELTPSSHYALTKLTVEEAIGIAFANTDVSVCSMRFQNVFGIGQSLINPYTGVLGIFTSLALKSQDIQIFENGEIHRDFVSVVDVAKILELCLSVENLPSRLNVGTGHPIALFDVAKTIVNHLGSSSKIELTKSFRRGDIATNFACLQSFNETFPDYKFSSFYELLPDYLNWVKQEGGLDLSSFEESMNELKKAGGFNT